MELSIGSTIGDYQVVGMLGAGGMGKVYKVRNVISDRVEAMKVLLPDLAESDLADRFLREIKVLASLEHPNIAELRTALRVQNQVLMVMEFVEGVTLEERLRDGPVPVAEALDYAGQALSALAYAHEHQVVHRDIKPANMMLTPSRVLKLMDFGIAKAATDRQLTMTGMTMGSVYYMSPEQIRGAADVDARADIYSMGVTLYRLVTGKRPFEGDSQFAIMQAHLERDPVPPVQLDPSLPAALNDIILMAVAREREQRFQSAEAMRKALASVLAAPPAAPAAAPAAGPSRSHRGLWVAAGALAAALAVVAVIQFGPKSAASAHRASPVGQALPPASAPPAPVEQAVPAASAPPAPAAVATPSPHNLPARRAASVPPPRTASPQLPAAAPVPAPVAATPPVAAPAPSAAASAAELQQVREELAQLGARAAAVQNSLASLQRAQAASGLGMRRDWVESASLMASFLQGAQSAVQAGDAAAARRLMEKAESAVSKLEDALGSR